MDIKVVVLTAMIFCHVIADYNMQGWLASAKQKSWWKENAPDTMYRFDYIAALFMHSFSWAFMTMLIPMIFQLIYSTHMCGWIMMFCWNVAIHMVVDDFKANEKRINLIQDQSIHMIQIVFTWFMTIVLLL